MFVSVSGSSDGVVLGLTDGGVHRRDGTRFDASALHVGNELVRDLGQHVLRQPCHAQHVVPRAVHVVPEGNKLAWQGGNKSRLLCGV